MLSNCVVTAASWDILLLLLRVSPPPPSGEEEDAVDAALAAAAAAVVAAAAFIMERMLPLIRAMYSLIFPADDEDAPPQPPVNHPIHTTNNEQ